jgi:hypothetical protein
MDATTVEKVSLSSWVDRDQRDQIGRVREIFVAPDVNAGVVREWHFASVELSAPPDWLKVGGAVSWSYSALRTQQVGETTRILRALINEISILSPSTRPPVRPRVRLASPGYVHRKRFLPQIAPPPATSSTSQGRSSAGPESAASLQCAEVPLALRGEVLSGEFASRYRYFRPTRGRWFASRRTVTVMCLPPSLSGSPTPVTIQFTPLRGSLSPALKTKGVSQYSGRLSGKKIASFRGIAPAFPPARRGGREWSRRGRSFLRQSVRAQSARCPSPLSKGRLSGGGCVLRPPGGPVDLDRYTHPSSARVSTRSSAMSGPASGNSSTETCVTVVSFTGSSFLSCWSVSL